MSIIFAILIFSFLIFIHEFGHFIVAKKTGVRVLEFAIGMGPKIFSKKKKNGELFSVRVLPIGGLKEKTMAALRYGISTAIIREDNLRDLEEIDQTVRSQLRFIPAATVDTVLENALNPLPEAHSILTEIPEEPKKAELAASISQ